MRPGHGVRLAIGLVALVLVVVLGTIGGVRSLAGVAGEKSEAEQRLDRLENNQRGGFNVRPPDSTLADSGRDETCDPDAGTPAVFREYETDDSPLAVAAFFDTELVDRSWQNVGSETVDTDGDDEAEAVLVTYRAGFDDWTAQLVLRFPADGGRVRVTASYDCAAAVPASSPPG